MQKILFKEFGKDVPYWITHNEPRVVATRGYGSKTMAPGTDDSSLVKIVAHHLLLSHGLAVKDYKDAGYSGEIGITLNLKPVYSSSQDEKDISNAQELDLIKNRSYLEPVLLGRYPDGWNDDSYIMPGDLELISTPMDFLGINYYSRALVKNENNKSTTIHAEGKYNCLGWETYPEGLHDILIKVNAIQPGLSLMVTENGLALDESLDKTGELIDSDRIEYIDNHVQSMQNAIAEGVNVKGYFVWSLMDNLEWSFGYKPRFGLIHIDHDTQKRTPKASFYFYKELIKKS